MGKLRLRLKKERPTAEGFASMSEEDKLALLKRLDPDFDPSKVKEYLEEHLGPDWKDKI